MLYYFPLLEVVPLSANNLTETFFCDHDNNLTIKHWFEQYFETNC